MEAAEHQKDARDRVTSRPTACSHSANSPAHPPSSKPSLSTRETSLSGRGARRAFPAVSGRVVSCEQPNGVSAGQACHSSVGGKYSPKVTTRPVVTPGYTVTTRFPRVQSDRNRRSGTMLTTRIGGLCPLSGNNDKPNLRNQLFKI